MSALKPGQKVYFEYGFSLHRGKVLAVLADGRILVRATTLAGKMGIGATDRPASMVHPR